MRHENKGKTPKQAHVAIPHGLHEEEFGRDGFYGPVSHLYHQNPPTGWTRIEGPLRPYAFNTASLDAATDSTKGLNALHRTRLLYNQDVAIYLVHPKTPVSWLFRNANADELYFVHQGQGTLESDFGPLTFEPGDYLVIPRGTTYRFDFKDSFSPRFLLFESNTPFVEPDRGLLGQQALYDFSVIETPEPQPQASTQSEYEVRVLRGNDMSSIFYPFHPLDVAGWKGNLSIYKLNVRDIRPIGSHRVHLPPSVHSTFKAHGFVVCTFLPRPLETDAEAERVPFYHRNIDYDEVIFYHDGDFFSRDGIKPGMISMHPQGIHHGPHPKAVAAGKLQAKSHTDEIAVMLDADKPLSLTPEAQAIEWRDYWTSWQDRSTNA